MDGREVARGGRGSRGCSCSCVPRDVVACVPAHPHQLVPEGTRHS